MCDSQFIRLTPPTLPSLLSILRISQFGACDTEGTSIILILCVCSFLEHSSDPSMKSTCAEPHMSLYLWQMWSAKAQESMYVCTISSGSRSLTKFKVENKNSRHLRTLTLQYLCRSRCVCLSSWNCTWRVLRVHYRYNVRTDAHTCTKK